jgi:predicted ATPase/DNA-binding SARP family transcriptional activator
MSAFVLKVLGTFEAVAGDQPLRTFRSVKNQALLAYLAVESNRPHTRAALAGLLWPDQPEEAARRNLRQALFQLRSILPGSPATGPLLVVDQTSVRFSTTADAWVDAAVLAALLGVCERHAHEALARCAVCLARLGEAVTLYQGEFLHGIYIDDSPSLEEWILARREWFHTQVLQALYTLADSAITRGDFSAAHGYALRQIELDPLREEAHRQDMRALAYAGQRSAALAAYETCWRILQTELAAPPAPETETLYERIRNDTLRPDQAEVPLLPAAQRVASPAVSLPPAATSFVGREAEIARLREWLLDPVRRLITLIGPGGAGKTRLALAAAEAVRRAFADGAWFISLAGVDNEQGLAVAVAQVVGLSFLPGVEPGQQLVDYLRPRQCLLLLDNFEQLATLASPWLVRLLEQAPDVKLLVTSRRRLGLAAEQMLPVAGLPYPDAGTSHTPASPLSYPTVRLFVERAQRILPAFELTDENIAAVVTICRLLDGLPLGIELAAGWVETYRCAEIAAAITSGLDFLAANTPDVPPRQQSLRAVFDHSWQLLQDEERRVLAQLGVFRGPFSREAAVAITGATPPQLTGLINQSLVRVAAPGRFDLHEVVRQFAAGRLDALEPPNETGQPSPVRERHTRYYLHQLAEQMRALYGPEPHKATLSIHTDLDNLRVAWRFAVASGLWTELDSALDALARFYELAGLYREAADLFAYTLNDLVGQGAQPGRLPIRLHIELARATLALGQHKEAHRLAQTAYEAALMLAAEDHSAEDHSAEDHSAMELSATALHQLAAALHRQDEVQTAESYLRQAMQLAQRAGNRRLEAEIRNLLGYVLVLRSEESGSREMAAALDLYRSLNDRWGEGGVLTGLAMAAQRVGDWAAVERYSQQALAIHETLGDRRGQGVALSALATVYATSRDYAASDRALQGALQHYRSIGYRVGEMQAFTALGVNAWQRADRMAARDYYEEALRIARQIEHLRGIGALLNNLGNLASDEEGYARAEALYREALELAMRSEDRYYMAARLHNLGNMRRFRGDYGGALAFYSESAETAAAIHYAWMEGSARSDLGLVCHFLGDLPRAVQELHRARLLAQATNDLWCECKVEAALAYCALLDQQDLSSLMRMSQAARRAAAAGESTAAAYALTLHGLALLYLQRWDEAQSALEEGLALRRREPNRILLLSSLAGLGELYRQRNDLARARSAVEEMLFVLGEGRAGGMDDPLFVYAVCVAILSALEDPRVAVIAGRARLHLDELCAGLPHAPCCGPLRERARRYLAGPVQGAVVWLG